MKDINGVPVDPGHVCIAFRRVPESLIEEPEVCEFCEDWQDGFCVRETEQEGEQ